MDGLVEKMLQEIQCNPKAMTEDVASVLPAWAHLDVMGPDTFNLTLARSLAGVDPSSPQPSSASITSSETSKSTPSRPGSPGETEASETRGSVRNLGTLVGIVVGCVAFFIALLTISLFLVRRRRKREEAALHDRALIVGGAGHIAQPQQDGSDMVTHGGRPVHAEPGTDL
ncbi:hypothetical protein FA13DRAFT_1224843 [Coprinellus micaceus]|uniref:Uncharacterized protein n=1 Tax=Coprinellus micaceus TaxID=71717 RepID=A0A4Y7TPF1_COPMI|nr:hypothetical protein FA13DRAFT_1224843 [Coprinellus micaceus]